MRRGLVLVPLLACMVLSGRGTALSVAVTFPAGWNLISGPAGSHVTGAAGLLYTFQPGDQNYESLPLSTPLRACTGYWAYFPAAGALTAGPDGSACTVQVPDGAWSMIGNPSTAGRAAISGQASAFSYGPAGYQETTALDPGQGAWVAGLATVSVAPPTSVSTPSQPGVPCNDGTTSAAGGDCSGHGGPLVPTGDCFRNIGGQIIHIRC